MCLPCIIHPPNDLLIIYEHYIFSLENACASKRKYSVEKYHFHFYLCWCKTILRYVITYYITYIHKQTTLYITRQTEYCVEKFLEQYVFIWILSICYGIYVCLKCHKNEHDRKQRLFVLKVCLSISRLNLIWI